MGIRASHHGFGFLSSQNSRPAGAQRRKVGRMTGKTTEGIRPGSYRPRIVDAQIERYLRIFGAIEITGTKWCGKTWSARAHSASITYVDRGSNLAAATADPSLMLIGDRPHVIDEWQLAPAIWDEVRHAVDDDPSEKGRYILTGSSTPMHGGRPHHSGAGRIGRIRMNPMTLAEQGLSSGRTSLGGLFNHKFAADSIGSLGASRYCWMAPGCL